jgi:hypothetical protein
MNQHKLISQSFPSSCSNVLGCLKYEEWKAPEHILKISTINSWHKRCGWNNHYCVCCILHVYNSVTVITERSFLMENLVWNFSSKTNWGISCLSSVWPHPFLNFIYHIPIIRPWLIWIIENFVKYPLTYFNVSPRMSHSSTSAALYYLTGHLQTVLTYYPSCAQNF